MSDASTTISEQYDRIVSRLGTIATDRCLLDSRLNDAIFIDDILLRLKLWAADVQHDQGSLGWAEKITEISIPLRQCLQKLDEQCELFVAALKQSEGRAGGESQSGLEDAAIDIVEALEDSTASAKDGLRQAVESLTAFTNSIKTAASVPKEKRTSETISQANQKVTEILRPLLSQRAPYILLNKSLPSDQVDVLLGAVVVPEELLEATVPSDGASLVRIPRNNSKVATMQSLTSAVPKIAGPRYLGNRIIAGGSKTQGPLSPTTVTKWELENPHQYYISFVKENENDLKRLFANSSKANIVLVSGLVTAQVIIGHLGTAVEQIVAFKCLKIENGRFGDPKPKKEPGGLMKCYHLIPNFSIAPPPTGQFQLGSILTDLKFTAAPLNLHESIGISSEVIHVHHTSGFQAASSKSVGGNHSVWASLLGMIGIRPGLLSRHVETEEVFRFDHLETAFFHPKEQYISQSMKLVSVLDYLVSSDYRPVFMITGLKIVRGEALIQTRQKRILSAKLKHELGLPLDVEDGISGLYETTNSTKMDTSSDFILAFRTSKIEFKKRLLRQRSKTFSVEEYNKGAILS